MRLCNRVRRIEEMEPATRGMSMSPDSAKFEDVVPMLAVGDLDQALDYYARVLGFRTDWVHGDPPALASVSRDAGELNLSQIDPKTGRSPCRLYFQITDVVSMLSRVRSCGAKVKESTPG
jgi:predicted enzyme related to lactoylglutathione lyase